MTTRTARFEKDVMRMRTVVVGAALAAIVAGVAAFVIGLRQPIESGITDSVEIASHH
jgi:hypothetical protein